LQHQNSAKNRWATFRKKALHILCLGFFHAFKSKEVLVKKWDKEKEDFSDAPVTDEEVFLAAPLFSCLIAMFRLSDFERI